MRCAVCYAETMWITVDIPDQIIDQIRNLGASPETYLRSLAERAVQEIEVARDGTGEPITIDEFLTLIKTYSHLAPSLPPEALTREAIYAEHD